MKLTPFLLFDGNSAEAMRFYRGVPRRRAPHHQARRHADGGRAPGRKHGKVVNALLQSGPIEFTATDWLHPTRTRKHGNNVGLFVNGGDLRRVEGTSSTSSPSKHPRNSSTTCARCPSGRTDTSSTPTASSGSSRANLRPRLPNDL